MRTLSELRDGWRSWAAENAPGEQRQQALNTFDSEVFDALSTGRRSIDLFMSHRGLTTLPNNWPDGITIARLDLRQNRLTGDSFIVPPSVRTLVLDFNEQLGTIPALSNDVWQLRANYCGLTSLNGLNAGLTELHARGNNIEHWPDFLPDSLDRIDVGHNQLTTLPSRAPTSLVILNASSNQITSLPENITEWRSNLTIHLDGNPLPQSVLDNLREAQSAEGYAGPRIRFGSEPSSLRCQRAD
ncbi:hypothetical protein [Burkholderia sp. Nafp2/4-1b]|uniref:hypothetical protein n=1 Tax=Burkholderia sp. Nafp2/4-1b TaxID=2116686 RepID=UPI0013CE8027|nr:hypothetical protein [Burkholderia sp. Nafp2/4-1b]